MQVFRGHPYFIYECKRILGKEALTKEVIEQASPDVIQRLAFLMANRFRCWKPMSRDLQSFVVWEYLVRGIVYPKGTRAAGLRYTAHVYNPPWIGPRPTGFQSDAPSAAPANTPPKHIMFSGSVYEKAASPWWVTDRIVACYELARRDSIMCTFERPHGSKALLDLFEVDGKPIHGLEVKFGSGQRAASSFVKRIPAHYRPERLPYSIPADISNLVEVLTSERGPISVDVSYPARFVLVIREARECTLAELVDRVTVRTAFEVRYAPDASDVSCTGYKIPTACPLAFSRIRYPVRGSACRHDSFFDLEAYLGFQKQAGLFLCPICSHSLPLEQLEMCDPFYRALISSPDADFLAWSGQCFEPVTADTSRKSVRPVAETVIELD